ncbi:MAG: hypothetical protein JWO67_3995 [Streptosporangiaceae bacterium]|nr:hypothetical protein [Streptosporangiaceae bacterium]
MRVEIDHYDRDGQLQQTLYADMPREEFDRIVGVAEDRDQADRILYISSRVKKDGPTKDWMFCAGDIKLRQVQR